MCFPQALEPYRELGDSPGYLKHDHNAHHDLALTEIPAISLPVSSLPLFHSLFYPISLYSLSPRYLSVVVASGIILVNFVSPLCPIAT